MSGRLAFGYNRRDGIFDLALADGRFALADWRDDRGGGGIGISAASACPRFTLSPDGVFTT